MKVEFVAAGSEYLDHAGDLTGDQLGVDDKGVIWQSIILSRISCPGNEFNASQEPTIIGAENLGYPKSYFGKHHGPRVRIINNPTIVVKEG